jgi:hypothetical protein
MNSKQIVTALMFALLSSHCASTCSDDKDKTGQSNQANEPAQPVPGARSTLRDMHVRRLIPTEGGADTADRDQ